jgi:TPR repeat protein
MPNFFKWALFRTPHIMFKRSICITYAVLFVAALVAAFSSISVALAEEDLYSASSPGMGSTQPDFTITEIKREQRISTLKIPGFRNRSAGASRWMMCAYTDLAIKRGFKYWAALYPRDSSDIIQLGFLNSKDEEIKTVLGSQFTGDGVIVSAVGDFAAFCGIKNASSADQEQKDKERFQLLSAKAAQGNADAQSDLGLMYADGQGTPNDYAEAIRWFRKAAEQGYAEAQFNLGLMYNQGLGMPQDYAEAVRWFRKAAEKGNAKAQFILGVRYHQGQGTPQDYAEAYKWYNLAASQGEAGASAYRDNLALSMTPEQIVEGHRRSSAFVPRTDSPTQIQSQTPASKPEKPVVQPSGKANDPFTGTWKEISQMIITPAADGISIQRNGEKPIIASYGKDYLLTRVTANTVRVDDHTLKTTTFSLDGKVISKSTETVSPDGKHYIQESAVPSEVSQRVFGIEYDRVGPVPSGDAFFGTWRRTSNLNIQTIKVEGETFTLLDNGRLRFAQKLDGKESEGKLLTPRVTRIDSQTTELTQTYQAKRIDSQTIEVIQKLSAKIGQTPLSVSVRRVLFQVKGDTLIETNTGTPSGLESDKHVTNFERMK